LSKGPFKQTKILASLGPASDNPKIVEQLISSGANGVRLNFSHGTHQEQGQRIVWAREASQKLNKPVAIVADLQGPKIRLGDLPPDGVELKFGHDVRFAYRADYEATGILPIQYDFSKNIKVGEIIYLWDGKLQAKVTHVRAGVITAQVLVGGRLTSRKGINLPDTDLGGDIITNKDLADVKYAASQQCDYVALSFVQRAADIIRLRKYLKRLDSDMQIIAKIETPMALKHIEEIIQAADGVMVARGDLAIEAGAEVVPIMQRRITGLTRKYRKFVIIATQMLASMVDAPQPTRAEVSDVATAAITGVDCVMLSDETNNGKYPVQAVKTMKRILTYTEDNMPLKAVYADQDGVAERAPLSAAAVSLSATLKATMIIAETKSGDTALNLSDMRPTVPIIVATPDHRVAQKLAIVYGCRSYYIKNTKYAATEAIKLLEAEKRLVKGQKAVLVYGYGHEHGSLTDTIRVYEAQ
jgi:pyruvate kinase